jgi:integrase
VGEAEARQRDATIADLVTRMQAQGLAAQAVETIAEQMIFAETLAEHEAIVRHVREFVLTGRRKRAEHLETMGGLAARWLSGDLAREFRGRVRALAPSTVKMTRLAMDAHVLPLLRDVPVAAITLGHVERVLEGLPEEMQDSSRGYVIRRLSALLTLAAFPLGILPANPIPKGFVPRGQGKAFSYLYPAEEARLARCEVVPLLRRAQYGILVREGLRVGSLLALTWAQLDLDAGVLRLEHHKTAGTQGELAFVLGQDTVRTLSAIRVLYPDSAGPFIGQDEWWRSQTLRDDLTLAGVDRPELFATTAGRRALRIHDLRASFVTIALALGKSEAWVMDRTGHTTSAQLSHYRRTARRAAELGQGWWLPLDELLGLSALLSAAGEPGAKNPKNMEKTINPSRNPPRGAPGTGPR